MSHEDLSVMQRPTRWPIWPFLPLTNLTTGQHGVLVDDGGASPRVYTSQDILVSLTPVSAMVQSEAIRFNTWRDLLLAGWRVSQLEVLYASP